MTAHKWQKEWTKSVINGHEGSLIIKYDQKVHFAVLFAHPHEL
jgi:hypothetical protein